VLQESRAVIYIL